MVDILVRECYNTHLNNKGATVPTYYYTQTVTYTLRVTADSEAAADEIAATTEVDDVGVIATQTGWDQDGFAE